MNASSSRRRTLAALGALALSAIPRFPRANEAAGWPDRPLRLVVGVAPGSGDAVPRFVASKLAESLGQSVVVENRPGASYNIASEIVARAPADGYTLMWATSQITLTPTLLGRSVVVDPVASFAPIAKILTTPVLVCAHASLGVSTLPELLALARQRPGALSYATAGPGTIAHLAMESILRAEGVRMEMIPYSNSAQAVANFARGEFQVYPNFYVGLKPVLDSGAARVLAIAGERRASWMPAVPTVVELGFPQAAVEPWAGFVTTAGTPPAIVARLHREIAAIVDLADTRARLAFLGMDPLASTPESFAADMRRQTAAWPTIVRQVGLTPAS